MIIPPRPSMKSQNKTWLTKKLFGGSKTTFFMLPFHINKAQILYKTFFNNLLTFDITSVYFLPFNRRFRIITKLSFRLQTSKHKITINDFSDNKKEKTTK